MRWIRLLHALLVARFKTKLKGSETSTLVFRVWVTDVDWSIANHAAVLTVMETGRLDLMVRLNFMKIAARNKWYFPLQSVSAQFYRPLKLFQRATLKTWISYIDDEWIYIEQSIVRKDKLMASAIVRGKVKKGCENVPTSEIIAALNLSNVTKRKHDLITSYENEIADMNSKMSNE